jgi:hypothetical protein
MGNFRFYRRLHIFPCLSVNLSKSGPSLTVGMRGAHVTFGHRGVTHTVGIPGTGIYYTSRSGQHTGYHSAHTETPVDPVAQHTAERVAGILVVGIIGLLALAIGFAIRSLKSHG